MHSKQRVRDAQLRVRRIYNVAGQVSAEEGHFRRDDFRPHESESSLQKLDRPQQTATNSEEDEDDDRVRCDCSANENGDSTRRSARETDGAIFFHFLLSAFVRETRHTYVHVYVCYV